MNDNLDTFNSIKKMIDKLASDYNDAEYIEDTINTLLNQFETAASAAWLKNELNDVIFDNDVVDTVHNQGYVVYDDFIGNIREIQHAIINFFGE